MSQLADLVDVVNTTPLNSVEQGKLFLALLDALHWEVNEVKTKEDAEVFLSL